LESYLGVNLLGTGPLLIKTEFTGPRSGKLFRSKFVRNGSSSYKNRIYRAAVSQRL